MKLSEYLEQDSQAVHAALQQAQNPAQTQKALEQALDRILLRFNEDCEDEVQRESAMHMLQSARSLLPLCDSVGDTKVWKLTGEQTRPADIAEEKPHALSAILLMLGVLLILGAAVLPVFLPAEDESMIRTLTLAAAAAAGALLIFFPARSMGRRKGFRTGLEQNIREEENIRRKVEVFIDPDKAWQCLRGLVMVADRNLEDVRERTALAAQNAERENGLMIYGDPQLYADLLEMAYASDSEEMRGRLRFVLHRQGIEAVDYSDADRRAFECLPGAQTITLRPALMREDAVIKKGLASVSG